jgi:translation initiation factor 2A
VLIWSQNHSDTTGKSYYGEHSLQYVQIFGGRDRQFVPVFQNMIQDVVWLENGERFLVIAGNQPAVATLYDKDCNALFEFGKRYRNTIRICPFQQLLLIGGFGNLKGEIDIWSLDSLEQVGKTRSDCAIGIEWSPDGKYLMTSVLYERVKVDNQISVFNGCGKKMLNPPKSFEVLNYAQWQPYPPGTFPKPNIEIM